MIHQCKENDYRIDSPLRTPTTLASLSSSTQDYLQVPTPRQVRSKSSKDTLSIPTKAKPVKSFQSHYLEFGLWPEMSQDAQQHLKTQYKQLKSTLVQSELKQLRYQQELIKVADQPCMNCVLEKAKHQATKAALEEAVALSSLLLKKVVELDSDVGRQNRYSVQ